MAQAKTQEQFLKEVTELYGTKYGTSKVNYINDATHVTITCPIHGDFRVTPNNFLHGKECPLCKHRHCAYTTEEWVAMAKEKFPQNDYSITKYKTRRTKIKFTCPIHGVVEQRPDLHIKSGCSLCAKEKSIKKQTKTHEQFVKEATLVHNGKYSYLSRYINAKTKVLTKCNDCGHVFETTPHGHLRGSHGCPICNGGVSFTHEEFVGKLNSSRNNEFTVLETYINIETPIKMKCNKCGAEFKKSPYSLLHLHGVCPICSQSFLESQIASTLAKHNLKFEHHQKFCWLKLKAPMHLDFYIPEYNIAIECQGGQHFFPVNYFGGEKGFKETQARDSEKKRLCEEHGVKLLYFTDYKDAEPSDVLFKDANAMLEHILKAKSFI